MLFCKKNGIWGVHTPLKSHFWSHLLPNLSPEGATKLLVLGGNTVLPTRGTKYPNLTIKIMGFEGFLADLKLLCSFNPAPWLTFYCRCVRFISVIFSLKEEIKFLWCLPSITVEEVLTQFIFHYKQLFFSAIHYYHLYHSTDLEICNRTVLAYHTKVISNIRKYTLQNFQPQFRDMSVQWWREFTSSAKVHLHFH